MTASNPFASAFGRASVSDSAADTMPALVVGDPDAPPIKLYVPTKTDLRRARVAIEYAQNLLQCSSLVASMPEIVPTRESIHAFREVLFSLPKAQRTEAPIKCARILLTHAQRVLSGYMPEV